jgi:hypothetical protein
MIQFETDAQRACYEKVRQWLTEAFGPTVRARENAPVFDVAVNLALGGSALAHVSVQPWGEDDATVVVRAYVVTDVEITPELMHFLLRENNIMRYGAFGLDKDDDIFFEHSIVGSTLDKEELMASVMAVLQTADKYDDQIRQRWGGRRALDRIKEE